MPLLIALEITPHEADVFRKMKEAGCFDLVNGSATLHFSAKGKLLKIERKLYTEFSLVSMER